MASRPDGALVGRVQRGRAGRARVLPGGHRTLRSTGARRGVWRRPSPPAADGGRSRRRRRRCLTGHARAGPKARDGPGSEPDAHRAADARARPGSSVRHDFHVRFVRDRRATLRRSRGPPPHLGAPRAGRRPGAQSLTPRTRKRRASGSAGSRTDTARSSHGRRPGTVVGPPTGTNSSCCSTSGRGIRCCSSRSSKFAHDGGATTDWKRRRNTRSCSPHTSRKRS